MLSCCYIAPAFQLKQNKFITFANENLKSLNNNILNTEYKDVFMSIPQAITEKIVLRDGREITIETGKLAKQADGSVVVRMGDTMLMATVVANKEANPGVDFLPLTVDYREKFYAGGKIPGNFFRREARPSDQEILTMRLVDRVLRPLFLKISMLKFR